MEQYERIAREAHDRQWSKAEFKTPDGSLETAIEAALLDAAKQAFDAGRSVSDLERRALEACEDAFRHDYHCDACAHAQRIGRESLEAKRPKRPWRLVGSAEWPSQRRSGVRYRIYNDATGEGRDYATLEGAAKAIAEQNAKASRG